MAQPDPSLATLIFIYMWPFAILRDASRGSSWERAAAYRHNQEMCGHLMGYSQRWALVSAVLWVLTIGAQELATSVPVLGALLGGLSMATGLLLAFSACVLVLTGATYLHLRHVDY